MIEKNQLILVKQLPIIEQQLKLVSEEIDKKLEAVNQLVCTEDSVKIIKEIRATLNKEHKEWEEKRKQVKEEVLKPYNDFETIYKENIIDKYKKADADLKEKIDTVETELKEKKKQEVKTYFNEYLQNKGIDFVTFENANITVTLSASLKSLKEQAKKFIDKISDDLQLIDTQEHQIEILVEYKKSLNVSNAITTISNRFKAIEEEQKLQEYILKKAREADNYVPTIEEVPQCEIDVPLQAPVVEEKEEILTLQFKVRGTRTQLKTLKEFLESGGYDYE